MPTRRITLAFNDGFSRSVLADVDGQLAVCQAGYGYPWQVTHVPSSLLIVQTDTESNAREAREALQNLDVGWEREGFATSVPEAERALVTVCILKLIQTGTVLPTRAFNGPPGAKLCWQFYRYEAPNARHAAVCLLPADHKGPHQWQPEVSEEEGT